MSKAGKPFSAILELDDEYKVNFVFQNNEEQESKEKESIGDAPVVATCPFCQQNVKLTETAYICVQNKKVSDEGDCSFRITRKLLDKEIPLEEFQKLVSDKKNWTYQGVCIRAYEKTF